ncbi:CDP-glycerol glycerophosphotransferase family protein [Microbacterium testaceum]|uniref:CDP-glycerol glycerophosphotransferase family protein n=1 Tax=Microbacterium testaceum TaxID=2033 RepID=UPI001D17C446|nr:CDP-glycerol glycerophosphotransferase family protein [Microbacterium testaceum]MCC4249418.1 CDP-glycerol glycerophosphotransferase family protein [Microbacterium testaceum]
MASFSFGAGNARKLRRIPLYLAGRLLTAVVPRSRERWVFGCAVGVADGALALWRVAEAAGERSTWLVADADQARDAEGLGIHAIRRDSLRGLWETARARVVVVTHGFGDVNRYAVTGAFVVQLWHGIPLKRIGLDSPETTRSALFPRSRTMNRLLALLYRRTMRQIAVLPAASHLVRGRLETAFGLDDARVPVTGEPRVDVLSRGSVDDRRRTARDGIATALGVDLGDRPVILYAPTWRDGAPDPAIPTSADWAGIDDVLARHEALLLVRPHPLGAGEYRGSGERVRMLGSDLVADVTPLLPGVDVLITDYSSLAFDAGLVPLPVVFFAPDLQAYSARRGLYGRYRDVAGDDPATTWGAALARVDGILNDPTAAIDASRRLSDAVHAHRDGRNAERVHAAIRARLDASPRRPTRAAVRRRKNP